MISRASYKLETIDPRDTSAHRGEGSSLAARPTDRPGNRACFLISMSWGEAAVPQHFRALAEELAQRGHRVVLIVDQQRDDAVRTDGNPRVFTWPSRRPTRLRDAMFLRRLIREHQPDCLLSMFGSTSVMMWVGTWMRVRHRLAGYFTLSEAIALDSTLPRWKRTLLKWRKRITYRLATKIVPNSQAGAHDIQQTYGIGLEDCNVMFLSLPEPHTPILPDTERSPHPVCVGRLHPTKGQDVLIRALAILAPRLPNLIIEFVGEGPQRQSLEALASELGVRSRCRFVGRVSHDEVLDRMARAPFTIVPSRSECFGLVNIESLAVGTPIIASDVGGIAETFDDGVEGYLIRPDDPEVLAERIERLMSDPGLRQTMSEKARRHFQVFSQSPLIHAQADWLETLVQS